MKGHDMASRVDRNGEEALIWSRKCSGYERQKTGPKLKNCFELEKRDRKDNGKRCQDGS